MIERTETLNEHRKHDMSDHSDITNAAAKSKGSNSSSVSSNRSLLQNCVSDDLQKLLEEEVVTYSWRRRGAASDKQQEASTNPTKPQIPFQEADCGTATNKETTGDKCSSQSRGVRFSTKAAKASDLAKEAHPSASSSKSITASTALVISANPKDRPCQSATKSNHSSQSSLKLDLDRAHTEGSKRRAGTQDVPDHPHLTVRLVTYDGKPPDLAPGPLSKGASGTSPKTPLWLRLWFDGRLSAVSASLFADDWLQGEIAWPDAAAGLLQRNLGCIAGMLSDASLQRAPIAALKTSLLDLPPAEALSATLSSIFQALGRSGPSEQELLVSEAEFALSKLEASAMGKGTALLAAPRLVVIVQREVLRLHWCQETSMSGGEEPDHVFNDAWVSGQLSRPADPEDFQKVPVVDLQRENQFLDGYLVRLLRLKRTLVELLEAWEKVDHYAILGVPATATEKELRNAYRRACLRLHPDKGGSQAQFVQLQDSYARILEERAKQSQKSPGQSEARTSQNADEPRAAEPRRDASTGGHLLALEVGTATVSSSDEESALLSGVRDAESRLRECREAVLKACHEAQIAETTISSLRKSTSKGNGVEALSKAQKAGDSLLSLSQQVGEMGQRLYEATMEVAENGLTAAARCSAVPTSLLLTDVSLSCSFEASRIEHAASQLLSVRLDTETTLQTLQTNLSMAKIIGTVDAETLKLSLGLISKAVTRIMSSIRQVEKSVNDALQRAQQCLVRATSVVRFATGRAAADAEAEDIVLEALPPPASMETGSSTSHCPEQKAEDFRPKKHNEPTAPKSSGQTSAAARSIEARQQNDRLLRQLNKEVLDLQKRAVQQLLKRRVSSDAICTLTAAGVAMEDIEAMLEMTSEFLLKASEDVVDAFVPEVSKFRASLARHFSFVEASGNELIASPVDCRAQLLRLAVLIDSQAVLQALEHQVKGRLQARCSKEQKDVATALSGALERHFERLATAVINLRMG